ncbi:MAG TPA: hypothetical protein VFE34_22790 [Dongiaceae bacterium]|nr:hypothetical protein [Dongiaceae bacterium]
MSSRLARSQEQNQGCQDLRRLPFRDEVAALDHAAAHVVMKATGGKANSALLSERLKAKLAG